MLARYEHLCRAEELDLATELSLRAINMQKSTGVHQAVAQSNISQALYHRAKIACNLSTLAEAECRCRESLHLISSDHYVYVATTALLGDVLILRSELSGHEPSLEDAITILEGSLRHRSFTNHQQSLVWTSLGKALCARFRRHRGPSDIDTAVRVLQNAINSRGMHHSGNVATMEILAGALHMRAILYRDADDLEEAIITYRALIQHRGCHHTHHISCLSGLAEALVLFFDMRGDSDALTEGMSCRAEVALIRKRGYQNPSFSQKSSDALTDGSELISDSFDHEGYNEGHVDTVRAKLRESTIEYNQAHRFSLLESLSNALLSRYHVCGEPTDLDEAIECVDQILDQQETLEPRARMSLSVRSAKLLYTRFKDFGSPKDVQRASHLLNNYLLSRRHSHTAPRALRILAEAIQLQSDLTGNLPDADVVLDISNNAVQSLNTPSRDPNKASLLCTIASLHLARFLQEGLIEDWKEARRLAFGALAQAPSNHPSRAACYFCICELYIQKSTCQDLMTALDYLRRALTNDTTSARYRLRSSVRLFALMTASDLEALSSSLKAELLDAYTKALSLLPAAVYSAIYTSGRLQVSASAPWLASRAAFLALSICQAPLAIEVIEQGRAIFWTCSLRLRQSFDDIPTSLRQELLDVTRSLDKSSTLNMNDWTKTWVDEEVVRRSEHVQMLRSIQAEIRSIPGLNRFMLPDKFSSLVKVSYMGPVVTLLASNQRCDAIIAQRGRVITVRLLDVNSAWLTKSSAELSNDMQATRTRTREDQHERTSRLCMVRRVPESPMTKMLESLWFKIVRPVIGALGLKVSRHTPNPSDH